MIDPTIHDLDDQVIELADANTDLLRRNDELHQRVMQAEAQVKDYEQQIQDLTRKLDASRQEEKAVTRDRDAWKNSAKRLRRGLTETKKMVEILGSDLAWTKDDRDKFVGIARERSNLIDRLNKDRLRLIEDLHRALDKPASEKLVAEICRSADRRRTHGNDANQPQGE